MEKVNISIVMEVIILEIGLRGKWKDMDSFMIVIKIYSMKASGRMITSKEEEHTPISKIMATGSNMRDSSNQE